MGKMDTFSTDGGSKFWNPSAAGLRNGQKLDGKKKCGRKQTSRCSSEYSTTSSIPMRHRTPPSLSSSEPPSQFEKTMDKLQKQVEENRQKIRDISTKVGHHDARIGALESRVDQVEFQQQSCVARLDNYERSGRIVCCYCNKNLSVSYIKQHWKRFHPDADDEDFVERLLSF